MPIITVKTYHGQVWTYDSLETAVLKINRSYPIHRLSGLVYWIKPSEYDRHGYKFGTGDDVVFYDEYNLRIPVWKVKETYFNIPTAIRDPYYQWGWKKHVKPSDFRKTYVPGIGRHRWHREQRVRTFQEIKENCYAENDECIREYKIRVRAARKGIPDSRDDYAYYRGRTKNWKKHREHQWKA